MTSLMQSSNTMNSALLPLKPVFKPIAEYRLYIYSR